MDPLKELRGLDAGHILALVKKIGGREVVEAALRGEKIITVEDVIQRLFDKHGRRIPKGIKANVCDVDRRFQLKRPKLGKEVDFANRILRLHGCLGIDTKVTAEQLKAETERLLAIIRNNYQIANIAKGVCLPIVLPKLTTDVGSELELYLDGVGKSYTKTFGFRKFHNYRKYTLTNKVSIVSDSRHDQLIGQMKQGSVIGLHFPYSLQNFSVNASREQMPMLPEGFILSGIDTPIAMAIYPDILAYGWSAPGLNMAALQWESADLSPSFRADDLSLGFRADKNELRFSEAVGLSSAFPNYSGSLLFIG